MTSNQANNDARIAIFYEHPEWFKPMFAELNRRGIAYDEQLAFAHQYDPEERSNPSLTHQTKIGLLLLFLNPIIRAYHYPIYPNRRTQ